MTSRSSTSGPGGEETILIAEIDRPRGLKGEVVATLHADDPARLDELSRIVVAPRGRPAFASEITGWKRKGDRVVLSLSGVGTVEAAESLRGAEIRIPLGEAAARAPEGRRFAHELAGLEVVDGGGRVLGVVEEVLCPAGQTLLRVGGRGAEFLVPAVAEICRQIDTERGRIVIEPPEGLIELNAV